jgi:hypothetical protein
MKVAIVGLSQATRHLVPKQGWQVWGLAWDSNACRYDRTFEIHADWRKDGPKHEAKLRDCPNLYMARADLPGSTQYPKEAIDLAGGYLESSIAYMFALAMHEGAQEIGLWGVEMKSDEEYGYQKPNMEYLIGLARGKGITVTLPEGCALLKPSNQFGYHGRYGWVE